MEIDPTDLPPGSWGPPARNLSSAMQASDDEIGEIISSELYPPVGSPRWIEGQRRIAAMHLAEHLLRSPDSLALAGRQTEPAPPAEAGNAGKQTGPAAPVKNQPVIDLARRQVTWRGDTWDVASVQALRWLKVLVEHRGEWITAAAIKKYDRELDGVRTDKLRKHLPGALSAQIESRSGAGSRWRA